MLGVIRRQKMRGVGAFLILAFACGLSCAQISGFNAAYLKHVDANITCGSPPEKYFKTQQGDILDPKERIPFVCNASHDALAHPPKQMTDGSLATYWQSTAREDIAFVVIDMKQLFFVHKISITFGDYRRPGAIRLEKSSDFGTTFIPWHYIVSSPGSVNCRTQFDVEHYTGVIDRVDRVVCQEYDTYTPLEYNETVYIDLAGEQRRGRLESHSPTILDWLSAVIVRFRFSDLFTKFDKMSFLWHHYTVREVEVAARCSCNAHGDGSNCPLNMTSGLRECSCQGNTSGMNCQKCLPLFNQFPWKKGNGAPWTVDPTADCEPCNCHAHADACVYNKTVDDLGLSLNASGQFSGGGVCLECKHNTKGLNCETCMAFYYRPLGKSHQDADACQACNCDVAGTANVSGLEFGECIRDDVEAQDHPDKAPGDCSCKSRVEGRQCDRCRAEYYRLTEENPLGCIDCQCHLIGTVNRSNVCNGSYEGLCPCKQNVDLRDCSECKDGFYNLMESNMEGCTDCECDRGGTVTPESCNKTTGVCECRPHVIGRLCDRLESNYYYPNVHFIHTAKDPYRPGNSELHVILNIPRTGFYRLLVGHMMKTSDNIQINVVLRHTNDSGLVDIHGRNDSISLTLSQSDGYLRLPLPFKRESDAARFLFMEQGRWRIDVMATSTAHDLDLDQIIAIPEEFITAQILGVITKNAFLFSCSVEGNGMQIGSPDQQLCLSSVFSMTVAFMNGGLACNCDPVGSNNQTCGKYEGECDCKPGVEGRDCGRCMPGYYNLTEQGCTPCGCKGPNQVCNVTTGECVCPANSVGRTCEACRCNNNTDQCLRSGECLNCQNNTTGFYCGECQNETYGDPFTQMCQACDCDPVGSLRGDCDRHTGQCACKTNVEGRNCNSCRNNTFDFNESGCHDCRCNPYGSASMQCEDSGQCPCEVNATGTKCTQCVSGFYGLPDMQCAECACNSTGSIPDSVCTNDTAGQCQCKVGVTGRACDRCMKFYTHFNESGCTACPRCVWKLQGLLEQNDLEFSATEDDGDRLGSLLEMYGPLEQTRNNVQQTKSENNRFHVRMAEGKIVRQHLRDSGLPDANNSFKFMKTRAKELSVYSSALEDDTIGTLEYVGDVENSTTQARHFVTDVENLIEHIVDSFKAYTEAGSQKQSHSSSAVHSIMDRSFSEEFDEVRLKSRDAENISAYVEKIAMELFNQSSLAEHMKLISMQTEHNFTTMQEEWKRTHGAFLRSIEQVYAQFSGIRAQMEEIKNLLSSEEQLLANAHDKATLTDGIVNNTKDTLDQATAAFEKYKSMVAAVSGELQVAMLEYDSNQNELLVKVLQGRDLAARDLPGLTSDVYVLVSTIPDWENEGTKKSEIINGTVAPVFPSFDIYRFKIAPDKLQNTKLRIVVFDYDSNDEDDFMGEVIVDLGTSGDLSVHSTTKWYKIQPQDVSQLGTGHFTPTSGLVDVTNLLQAQIETVKPQLGTVWAWLLRALHLILHLVTLAQEIERTFNSSHAHGAFAVSAIQRYVTTQQLLNRSLELMTQSKETLESIMDTLSKVPTDDLKLQAKQAKNELELFYNETVTRNIQISSLEYQISVANSTFLRAIPQWYEINRQFPVMQSAAASLQAAAVEAPAVLPPLLQTKITSDKTRTLVTSLLAQLENFGTLLNDLLLKITFMETAARNSTRLVDEAFDKAENASEALDSKPDETVLSALAIEKVLPDSRIKLTASVASLTSKMHQLRNFVGQFRLALHLTDKSSAEYHVDERSLHRREVNEISFDLRTNSTTGLVVYLVGSPMDMTPSGSSLLSNSVAFYLENGRVRAALSLTEGEVLVENPIQVNNNEWYEVHLTWTGSKLIITVKCNLTHTETNSAAAPSLGELKVDNSSVVYVGGLSNGVMTNLMAKYGHYIGVIDNLVIDQARYNLWRPDDFTGTRLYAKTQYPHNFCPDNGVAASFFGYGFVQHNVGEFNTSQGYSVLELDFRTLQESGMLFAVTDTRQRYIFAVFLKDGHVKFRYEIDQDVDIKMDSRKSSYNDGRWYHVIAKRTFDNSSLTITPLADSNGDKTNDMRTVYTGKANMAAGTTITFGAPDPNSKVSPPLNEIFAGDMKNVHLSGRSGAPLQPRYFSNQSLNRTEQGVATFGVIKGQIERGVRFYGYMDHVMICSYAGVTTQLTSVSSLTFTFKTSELCGLLLYSSKEIQGATISVYMAVLHGNLLILLNDSSSSGSSLFETSEIDFSDNKWRTVHLNYTQSGYSLFVNDTHVHTAWFGNLRKPLEFAQAFFVGGVPSGVRMPLILPVTWCFRGGMKHFKLDSTPINLFSGRSVGVSRAGVTPAIVPPPPPPIPPSCGDVLAPLHPISSHNTLRFGGIGKGKQRYIGFNLNKQQRHILNRTSRIVFQFRASSADGVLLYIADNLTHPTQFTSLEMVNGHLRYQFDTGKGPITVLSGSSYLDSKWFTVNLFRVLSMGAVYVEETLDYNKRSDTMPVREFLAMAPFYVGGVPDHVTAPHLINREIGFTGCLRNLELKSTNQESTLDLSAPDHVGKDAGSAGCYKNVEPGLGFNASAWIQFDNFTLRGNFDIQLEFRTSTRNGLILHVSNSSEVRQADKNFMSLEQSSGTLVLTYNSTQTSTRAVWIEPGFGNKSKSSYFLCQMTWHTIKLSKNGRNITMAIDQLPAVTVKGPQGGDMAGDLYLGGLPANMTHKEDEPGGFHGCIKTLHVNGEAVDFTQGKDNIHVTLGCPLNAK